MGSGSSASELARLAPIANEIAELEYLIEANDDLKDELGKKIELAIKSDDSDLGELRVNWIKVFKILEDQRNQLRVLKAKQDMELTNR